MNTIGPASEGVSSDFPPEWASYRIIPSLSHRRTWSFSAAEPGAITYRTIGAQTHYGIGTHKTSFIDNGTALIVPSDCPEIAAVDAALQLARSRYGEPLTIAGSDAFKGAVLSRAVELGIPVGNPELATLYTLLNKQRYPDRVRPGTSSPSPNGAAQQAQPSVDTAPDALRIATEERLRALYPEGDIRMTDLPDYHLAGEIRIYRVLQTSDGAFSIDHGTEGSYSLHARTLATQNVREGDYVSVQTGSNREVTAVSAHTIAQGEPIPTSNPVDDALEVLTRLDHGNATVKKTRSVTELQDELWNAGEKRVDKRLTLQESSLKDLDALLHGANNRSFEAHAHNEYGVFLRDTNTNNVYLVPHARFANSEAVELEKPFLLTIDADGTLRSHAPLGEMPPMTTRAEQPQATPSQPVAASKTFGAQELRAMLTLEGSATIARREYVPVAETDAGLMLVDRVANTTYLLEPGSYNLSYEPGAPMQLALGENDTITTFERPPARVTTEEPAHVPVPTATVTQPGFEAIPQWDDMTRHILLSELDANARAYLCGPMGKDPSNIKMHDFEWPTGNVSRTIYAANDLGIAVGIPSGRAGAFTVIARDKVPFPDGVSALQPGDKISFKTVNGVKQMSIPRTPSVSQTQAKRMTMS